MPSAEYEAALEIRAELAELEKTLKAIGTVVGAALEKIADTLREMNERQ